MSDTMTLDEVITRENAATWLNEAPAQSDGEVSATLRNDGTVGTFYIAPA
jgi:hypothetical protein